MSKWENDLSSPDTENLIALAALLGVELSQLVSQSQDPPAVAGKPEVKRGVPWLKLALPLSVILAMVFFCLWQAEGLREKKLELLCQASAASCLESLLEYEKTGSESQYLSAVSEFRAFIQGYHLLTEDSGRHGNTT